MTSVLHYFVSDNYVGIGYWAIFVGSPVERDAWRVGRCRPNSRTPSYPPTWRRVCWRFLTQIACTGFPKKYADCYNINSIFSIFLLRFPSLSISGIFFSFEKQASFLRKPVSNEIFGREARSWQANLYEDVVDGRSKNVREYRGDREQVVLELLHIET